VCLCVCVCISSSCARCAPVVASRWLASRRRAAAAAAVRAPGAAGPRTPRVCSWDCRPLSAFKARETTGLGLAGVASHSRVFLAVVVVFGVCWLPLHGHLLLLYTTTWAFASSLDPPHGHLLLLYTPTRAFASLNPYTGICCFSVPLQRHLLLLYTATRAPAPRLPRPAAARALVLAMTHRRQHRTGARAGTPSSASPATCSPTATRASTRSSTTTVLPPGESL